MYPFACQCVNPSGSPSRSFVGSNNLCESSATGVPFGETFYANNWLWDGIVDVSLVHAIPLTHPHGSTYNFPPQQMIILKFKFVVIKELMMKMYQLNYCSCTFNKCMSIMCIRCLCNTVPEFNRTWKTIHDVVIIRIHHDGVPNLITACF